MAYSNKVITAIAITILSYSPAIAGAKNVSDLDLGSGRFWEMLLRMFG